LAIEQRCCPSTALDDLLGIEEGKIEDPRLYRRLDRVAPHKTKLDSISKSATVNCSALSSTCCFMI